MCVCLEKRSVLYIYYLLLFHLVIQLFLVLQLDQFLLFHHLILVGLVDQFGQVNLVIQILQVGLVNQLGQNYLWILEGHALQMHQQALFPLVGHQHQQALVDQAVLTVLFHHVLQVFQLDPLVPFLQFHHADLSLLVVQLALMVQWDQEVPLDLKPLVDLLSLFHQVSQESQKFLK